MASPFMQAGAVHFHGIQKEGAGLLNLSKNELQNQIIKLGLIMLRKYLSNNIK